jgi:hypothetical protein
MARLPPDVTDEPVTPCATTTTCDALTRMLAHRATQAESIPRQAGPPYRPVPETRREIIRILRLAQRDIEAAAQNGRIDADIRAWLLARSQHYKAEIAAALGIAPVRDLI